MAEQVHLWREYRVAPFQRFACTIEEADTESGYRIVDYDPAVGDVTFLHVLHEHMQKPIPMHLAPEQPNPDGIVDRVGWGHPGQPGHFAEAVRQVPGATVRHEGRS